MKTRAERRKNDYSKAIRKKNIAEHNYGFSYYDNLHQYSKNKIHCSCPLCRGLDYGNSLKGLKHSNMVKVVSMNSKLEEI